MKCNQCGWENEPNVCFCVNCGSKLDQTVTVVTQQKEDEDYDPESELERDEDDEVIYTRPWLLKWTRIRGWLTFFMVILLIGSLLNLLMTIDEVNRLSRYGFEGVAIPTCIAISIISLAVAVYAFVAFKQRYRNAVFFAQVYLVSNLVTGLLTIILLSGFSTIGTIVGSCIWLAFLSQSVVVGEVIPSSYRRVTPVDWTVGGLVVAAHIAYPFIFKASIDSFLKGFLI